MILLVGFAIPGIVYLTVKLCLEDDVLGFPDIERAWMDGMQALARQQLDLRSSSAVINELRAFQHDFRAAARRLASERAASSRRPR